MKIPFVSTENIDDNLLELFDKLEKQPINQSSWGQVIPSPSVSFKIAHTNEAILLQYDVKESETRAEYSMHNKPISRDSCVEFFIEFEGEKEYFNLEFNCLGACLAAYGPGRKKRKQLSYETIELIQVQSKINRSNNGSTPGINWMLTLVIPLKVFSNSKIFKLSGQKARANFFKCGDRLSTPHFLSWEKIETPEPDFHQPLYFKELTFL